jgi:tetratricopeptide (TPR) repeat protein
MEQAHGSYPMKTDSPQPHQDRSWLLDEHPDLYHVLRALDGEADALLWLEDRGPALHRFALALNGDRTALKAVGTEPGLDWDDVNGLIGLAAKIEDWVEQAQPQLHLLFAAVRGDDEAMRKLKRHKTAYARMAEALRPHYRRSERRHDAPEGGTFADGAAADVSCLVGEMHLKQGEFDRAVEAFTRVLESAPSADAYEGRARAYRALADLDDEKALLLRKG